MKKKIRFINIYISVVLVLSLACSHDNKARVTIFHTNDMHAQYLPVPAMWSQKEPKPMIGGMVALEKTITKYRSLYYPSILLDAGDIMTGTPISNIEYKGANGGAFVEMMNLIGYDAFTVGNHEFDQGTDNLNRLLDLADFDVLSANLYSNRELFTKKAWAVYNVTGKRIGVIGLLMENLAGVVNKKNIQGLEVKNPIEVAADLVEKLDPETDLLILLTHQGLDADIELAKNIKNVDIIVGGHSHTRLDKVVNINGVLIVQAGSGSQFLGRLTVDVAGDSVASYEHELIPVWAEENINKKLKVSRMVTHYKNIIDKQYKQKIGTLLTDWKRSNYGESNLGNFLTDALREKFNGDFAVLNGGGIRKDLPAGAITRLDINEMLPFSNYIVLFKCTGQQLVQLVQKNADASVEKKYNILQVSGLSYKYRKTNNAATILSAEINSKPIQPNAVYTGVAVDFIVHDQAEKYFGFQPKEITETGVLLSDVIIDYIKLRSNISSKVLGRIRKIK